MSKRNDGHARGKYTPGVQAGGCAPGRWRSGGAGDGEDSGITLEDYPRWQEIIACLKKEDLVVIILGFQCALLLRTFSAMDRFLTPVYTAFIEEKISKTQFDDIRNQVEVIFHVYRSSLNEMLGLPRVRKRERIG